MAVREALLVLLTHGPAYGFQLHAELESRIGHRRRVNVGQSYATIDRLAKAGEIESAGQTDDGLPLHRLTAAGRRTAEGWLDGADATGADPWDETIDRVLIASSLPGFDVDRLLAAERARWRARVASASETIERPTNDRSDGELRLLASAADAARARAALDWLHRVEETSALSFAFRTERPRRGRPRSEPTTHPPTSA